MRTFLVLASLLLLGCAPHRKECEELCTVFVDESGCGFRAWKNVAQCTNGCLDDLYRRDDSDVILGCYWKAVEGMDEAEAALQVGFAEEARIFDAKKVDGSFDRQAEIDALVERKCDPFAIVQCKTQAARVIPDAPLLSGR